MDRDEKGFQGQVGSSDPAIGYSIAVNLGGERQMTVQCFVGQDEDEETINRKIDRVFRVADRQKAKYDLERLYEVFEQTGRTLHNFLNAIPMAENEAKHRIAVLTVELRAKEEARKEVFDAAYAEHANTRKGVFVPKGLVLQKLNAADVDINKIRAAIDAAPHDTKQHRDKVAQDVFKYQDDLKKQRQKINDLRYIAGLPPYVLFADEEAADPLKG